MSNADGVIIPLVEDDMDEGIEGAINKFESLVQNRKVVKDGKDNTDWYTETMTESLIGHLLG